MLTPRDKQILESLSRCVKAFSIDQIASIWWGEDSLARKYSGRRMARLQEADYIKARHLMIRPVSELKAPLVRWILGQPDPDMAGVSYQLKHRWKYPPKQTLVFVATEKTARMFGGFAGKLRLDERSHDLVLAEVFLLKFKEYFQGMEGEDPQGWMSESMIRLERFDQRQKLPDAIYLPNTAIEVGGRYGKEKLEAFHQYCQSNRLNYELW